MGDGMEALKIAHEKRPDLIIVDLQLREGAGLETTKWIKEDDHLSGIPVIAVTDFAMKGDEQKIREGCCEAYEAYIAKPISVSHSLKTDQEFLG